MPIWICLAGRVGFSFRGGGTVDLAAVQQIQQRQNLELDAEETYNLRLPKIDYRLNALELYLLQRLIDRDLPITKSLTTKNLGALEVAWIRIEKVLREYIQYHIGKTIRSANLVDNLYIEF